MLHTGLDPSRRKVDVCLIAEAGEIVDEWASPADVDGLRGPAGGGTSSALEGTVDRLHGKQFGTRRGNNPQMCCGLAADSLLVCRRSRLADSCSTARPVIPGTDHPTSAAGASQPLCSTCAPIATCRRRPPPDATAA